MSGSIEELGRLRLAIEALPGHIAGQQRDQNSAFMGELYRGVKRTRFAYIVTPAASTFTIPGPEQGFIWDVRLITGTLSASDSVAAYAGDSATNRLVAYTGAPGAAPAQPVFVINPSSRSVMIDPGESVFLQTSGAGNLVKVMIAAIQVPAEMQGKLLI